MERVRKAILLIMLAVGPTIWAQPPGGDKGPVKDWIRTKRIGFFTDKLDLTVKEATVFWPVYNAYLKEVEDLRDEHRKVRVQTMLNLDDMKDGDIEKNLDEEYTFRQNELNIQKKYLGEWKKVLPMKKIALLLKAEEEFKIWILKEWKNHGLGPGKQPGDGPLGPPGGPPAGEFDR